MHILFHFLLHALLSVEKLGTHNVDDALQLQFDIMISHLVHIMTYQDTAMWICLHFAQALWMHT